MSLPAPYWTDGKRTIYHADCREILPHLPKVDLVLTDPPYGIGWSRGANPKVKSKAHSGIQGDKDTSARDYALSMFSGPCIVFGSFYAPFPDNLKQVSVWKKPPDAGLVGSTTGLRRDVEPIFFVGPWPVRTAWRTSLFTSTGGLSAVATKTGHPHTKPLRLVAELLGTILADTILDPFMGSGTTLVAAKQLGREAIGIEIEEKYCEIAAKRLSQTVLFDE